MKNEKSPVQAQIPDYVYDVKHSDRFTKRDFFFPSSNGRSKIFASVYEPKLDMSEWKGSLQLIHGYAEHTGVYHTFAADIASEGYLVFIHDQIGHGLSVQNEEEKMNFGSYDAMDTLMQDTLELHKLARENVSEELPAYIMGHSMGSLITRCLLIDYGKIWSKAIIMGTGDTDLKTTKKNQRRLSFFGKLFGGNKKNSLVNYLGIGHFNNKFMKEGSINAWTTRDPGIWEWKDQDKLRGGMGSTYTFYTLNQMLMKLRTPHELNKMPKDIEILITSGEDDPFGEFGQAPPRVAKLYKDSGVKDVDLLMYPDARHEILLDSTREDVIFNILQFLSE